MDTIVKEYLNALAQEHIEWLRADERSRLEVFERLDELALSIRSFGSTGAVPKDQYLERLTRFHAIVARLKAGS
jgi:hypothetical protein